MACFEQIIDFSCSLEDRATPSAPSHRASVEREKFIKKAFENYNWEIANESRLSTSFPIEKRNSCGGGGGEKNLGLYESARKKLHKA